MRKKLYVGICLGLLIFSLTACGQKETQKSNETKSAEQTEGNSKALKLFTVSYSDDWKVDEENLRDEDKSCKAVLYVGESASDAEKSLTISAYEEQAITFRKDLISKGISLEDYAEGKVETVTYGDTSYVVSDSDSGDTSYLYYRHPESGVTYFLYVKGDREEEQMKALLEGVTLNLSDTGKEEAPWPWEGAAFEPQLQEQMVGSYTIVPEYVPFEESMHTMSIMDYQFAQVDDKLYVLNKKTLSTYDYSKDGLKFVTSMDLDKSYETISFDKTGMLYLSPGLSDIIGIKDNKQVMQAEVDGYLVMDPSGKWGITSWVSNDTQKVTAKSGTLVAEPWILTNLSDDEKRQGSFKMLQDVAITDSFIMVAGNTAGEDSHVKIVVYDHDGKEKMTLGGDTISDPDCLGAITGMAETKNGLVATDGNLRKILYWAKDGTFIGKIDVRDIFGTSYPWLEDMQLLDDGSILIQLTQTRDDKSSDELMFFRLTGF